MGGVPIDDLPDDVRARVLAQAGEDPGAKRRPGKIDGIRRVARSRGGAGFVCGVCREFRSPYQNGIDRHGVEVHGGLVICSVVLPAESHATES